VKRRTRLLLYSCLGALTLLLAAGISGILVLRSAWFHDSVRDRIISEVERSSGGRAEIGHFDFDWKNMTATVKPFVLHGKEKSGQPVLLRADSIQVGLKVVSAFRRDVDIASLIVEHPAVHLIVYPDGTTNLPAPKARRNDNVVQRLLDLAVQRFELREGEIEFQDEKTPFDVRGQNLRAAFDFDAAQQVYKGHVSSRQLRLDIVQAGPLAFDFDSDVRLLKDQLEFSGTHFVTAKSRVDAAGTIRDIAAPRGEFDVRAALSLSELGSPLRVPIEHRGDAEFNGKAAFSFGTKFEYSLRGRLTARDLAFRNSSIQVSGVVIRSALEVSPAGARLPNLAASALGGSFTGSAELRRFRELRLDGDASGFALGQLAGANGRKLPWSGTISGPAHISGWIVPNGLHNITAQVDAQIIPAPGGVPVRGQVDFNYSQAAGSIQLGQSWIATPRSRVVVSGMLGQTLQLSLRSSDLNELTPAIEMAGIGPGQIPIHLENGAMTAQVTVVGPLEDPRLSGNASISSFEFEGKHFDSASADFVAAQKSVQATNLVLTRQGMRVTGTAQLGLSGWKPTGDSALSASLNVAGADLAKVLAEAGHKGIPVTGNASAVVTLAGTYAAPSGNMHVRLNHPAAYGEQFDAATASIKYAEDRVEVSGGEARLGQSKVDFSGTYAHRPNDWETGELTFRAETGGIPVATLKHVQQMHEGLNGDLSLQASGQAHLTKGDFNLDTLQSRATLQRIAVDASTFGNLQLTAATRERTLNLKLAGNLRESRIEGQGEWRLDGDDPGQGEIRFTAVRIATLKRLATKATGKEQDPPFEGVVEGKIGIAGPLKKPEDLVVTLTLPRVEITPRPEQRLRAGARAQDLALRNVLPVVIRGTAKQLNFESANFSATETNLDIAGTVGLNEQAPWNVTVRGGINLAILQLFNADLVAQGSAVVSANVKGALRDPQVNGKLELRKASLYLGDIPVGVDNANGVVLFDRGRATIQKLTAEAGGGQLALSGFVGFGSGALIYRVQATADQVRFRYPEGVSLTLNSALNLNGTSANSLVSGTVTVMRAGFTPRADVGTMLAQFAGPAVSAPETPNEYLRSVQFDVRVESGPSLEVTTSLARNIEAEAELRLRGTAARPVLLGTVSVTEGEIQLFGSKYDINRGEIRFLNPTRIEPSFDVDLQTRARGIDVAISFSGTLNKLNMTYRSDPPLQPNEIIALLAMGRDPATTAGLASAQVSSQGLLQTGTSALGQVITSPVSGRLERFFGVSRLKIDPQLTGVDNIPQARLTLEQAISRDITLTYITNLARTNEQLVQIQWDINRHWSAIATREENGVFGIDFQYRKRFK
jgi:translocation and assembly module TamB